MLDFLGSLIGGLGSLTGGIFGQRNQAAINNQNINEQISFAQNAATWKAQDVTRAQDQTGINRLALLGVPTASFSNNVGSSDLGSGIANMGQNIGRAVASLTDRTTRKDELENKLLEAKIANVNADTVGMLHKASQMATALGSPGTGPGVNVPFPTPDPRGPVIPLVQRALDWRTGEIVNIPSEKAASPLQTLAAAPTNAAMGLRAASEGLIGFDGSGVNWVPLRGDVWRGVDNSQYAPF